jgi:HPt (histidine-containing phosphotransfer) domain-containing protein
MVNTSAMNTYRDFLGEDFDDFLVSLIDSFLQNTPRAIEDLRMALQVADYTAFMRSAHTIKSNSRTLGADLMADLAQEIEMMGNQRQLDGAQEKIAAFEAEYGIVCGELGRIRAELRH